MIFGPRCVDTEVMTATVVCLIFWIVGFSIFIRAISSWFNVDPRAPVMQVLYSITEPVIEPIRRIMPRMGMMDLSPLVAILAVYVISIGVQMLMIDAGLP